MRRLGGGVASSVKQAKHYSNRCILLTACDATFELVGVHLFNGVHETGSVPNLSWTNGMSRT